MNAGVKCHVSLQIGCAKTIRRQISYGHKSNVGFDDRPSDLFPVPAIIDMFGHGCCKALTAFSSTNQHPGVEES
jgi:hypothetical protein